jgi:hypothetical protein
LCSFLLDQFVEFVLNHDDFFLHDLCVLLECLLVAILTVEVHLFLSKLIPLLLASLALTIFSIVVFSRLTLFFLVFSFQGAVQLHIYNLPSSPKKRHSGRYYS